MSYTITAQQSIKCESKDSLKTFLDFVRHSCPNAISVTDHETGKNYSVIGKCDKTGYSIFECDDYIANPDGSLFLK